MKKSRIRRLFDKLKSLAPVFSAGGQPPSVAQGKLDIDGNGRPEVKKGKAFFGCKIKF